MATWATVAEVLSITGETVTETQVEQAGHVIETWANRTYDLADRLRPRDRHWLKVATAYQVAWQINQPGYFTNLTNVTDYNQDGMLTRFDSKADQSLAPNASRSLKNLSWKISRTLRTPDADVPVGVDPTLIDYTMESSDNLSAWTPMNGSSRGGGC